MARGRKKGGLQINKLQDREEIIGMIINQINSLNKKINKFKEKGINEQLEYTKNIISEDMGQFNENDNLRKSKVFYRSKNTVWLKKSLSALHKINNHEFFGTTRKYEQEVTNNIKLVKTYVEKYLRQKGYDDKFINEVVNSKNFYVNLFEEFKEVGKGYGSDQAIDKVALTYQNNIYDSKETEKILSNIESSRNVINRITETQEALDEFMRNKKMR
ncbi:MAG: hypothetical protein RSF67_08925 [Clostridia bacterium]